MSWCAPLTLLPPQCGSDIQAIQLTRQQYLGQTVISAEQADLPDRAQRHTQLDIYD
jgi:hypothetical protein